MFSLFTILELQLIFNGTLHLFIIAKAWPFLLPNLPDHQTTYVELPVLCWLSLLFAQSEQVLAGTLWCNQELLSDSCY